MRKTEYSHDGQSWFSTAAPNWQFKRETEDLELNRTREDIEKWLHAHSQDRVEYSTDGGYSFVPFRRKFPNEDAGRVFTMQKMHYVIRSIKVEEVSSLVGGNFGFSNTTNQRTQIARQNRPRVIQKLNYIFRLDSRPWFSENPHDADGTMASYISMITQYIPMTMAERNQNEISTGNDLTDPIIRGHVYKITEIEDTSMMDQSLVSYFTEMTRNRMTEYAMVASPRSYDEESQAALNVFCCAILGSRDRKYYVHSRNNPFKIGDTFFVKKSVLLEMQRNLIDYGAYYYYENVQSEDQTGELVDIIMKLDQKLQNAIESDDTTTLATALYEAMELRNETVDALTKLNATIQKAREKALSMVAGSGQNNS